MPRIKHSEAGAEWTPERLRACRARLGMTQAELAQRLGTTNIAISRWENSQAPLPMHARMLTLALQALESELEERARAEGVIV